MNRYSLIVQEKLERGQKVTHSELINALMLALGERPDIGKFWKRNTGAYFTAEGAYIRYGLVGGADIEGILNNGGQHCEVEGKVGKDKQSVEQKNFEAMITQYHGIYIVARDITSVLLELEQHVKR